MTQRARRERDQLDVDRAVLREGAAAIRAAPATTRWAVLNDLRSAGLLAGMLDAVADRLEWMPEHDRRVWVRIAAELTGRRMDRPAVRRARRR